MTTKIARTGTTPTNTNKYTWSAWIKRNRLGTGESIVYNYYDGNNRGYIAFDSDDKLFFYDKTGSEQNNCYATRRFRDINCWYHIHVKADSTLGSDRFVVHINGLQETITGTTIDQNDNLGFKTATGTNQHSIGTNADSTANPFSGIISHVHYVDGLALPYTDFGSTDSTTGEWKINTSPTVSEYGANGYFILKDGNSVTDQSGKGNNFTVTNGTLTKTEDCPSNVFATLNKLTLAGSQYTLRYGNNSTYGNASSAWRYLTGTLGASSGKYYWEMKFDNTYGSDPRNILVGILDFDQADQTATNGKFSGHSRGYAIDLNDGKTMNNTTSRTSGATYSSQFSTGDILGVAMDLDNSKLYFAKNGTWQNSSDPTNGTNAAFTITSGYTYTAAISSYYNTDEVTFNFGNGYFGISQVASAGTNASGIGIFEYDVPTGYTALSTKGLNE